MIVVIILLSASAYVEYYPGDWKTNTNTQATATTTTTNGSLVYVYPTANLSSEISAAPGEVFGVQVSSNAGSTAYDWNVSSSGGIKLLNITVVSTSTLAGGSQVRNYWFQESGPGNQSITMKDVRQFSPYKVGAVIQIQVIVTSVVFQAGLDTLAGGGAELAMLSYNFQVNSTGGTLFIVFKDYSNSTTVISALWFDNTSVTGSSAHYSSSCADFAPGIECEVTLNFGGVGLPLPSGGSSHSLAAVTGDGQKFDFSVTAGTTAEASCTFSTSC